MIVLKSSAKKSSVIGFLLIVLSIIAISVLYYLTSNTSSLNVILLPQFYTKSSVKDFVKSANKNSSEKLKIHYLNEQDAIKSTDELIKLLQNRPGTYDLVMVYGEIESIPFSKEITSKILPFLEPLDNEGNKIIYLNEITSIGLAIPSSSSKKEDAHKVLLSILENDQYLKMELWEAKLMKKNLGGGEE